jgi:tRNA (guanine37-N1)-methyltransferase
MLSIHVVTIFPKMVEGPLTEGILQRAVDKGVAAITVHDLRTFTDDRHRTTDDAPFGGGPGMVMKAEPFFRAMEAIGPAKGNRAVVLLSPRGRRLDQATAERFSLLDELVLLCGRYEGVDERVSTALVTEELSLGDFVLTGGETAALAVIEASVRLVPGALGDAGSADADSFADGLLDFPHYTRPATLRGLDVPEVLLSGDHGRVRRWRRKESLRATKARRPDLLASAPLGAEDLKLLREIETEDMRSAPHAAGESAELSPH